MMDTAKVSTSRSTATTDLIPAIRRSGILPSREIVEIEDRIRSGRYPAESLRLATRLVQRGTLTEYQARCLLHSRERSLVVGRHVILDLLGRGSMGRVYLARHRLLGRLVALKFIAGGSRPGRDSLSRFFREMRIVALLEHPHIVQALDADMLGAAPYIVMEYVGGKDLGRCLADRGRMSPGEVALYGEQAARALAHAHDRGVVHRDVKPSNLLLGNDGRLRLLDLGLGALLDREGDEGSFATAAGIVVGTVEYMSPEQAAGAKLDGRSDLYSLGCAIYHLLTGRVPFPDGSRVERLARRITEQPPPASMWREGLPLALLAVLDRMLAVRPADRYQTAKEAADALHPLADSDSAPATVGSANPGTLPLGGGTDEPVPTDTAALPPAAVANRPASSRFRGFIREPSAGRPIAAILAVLAAFCLGFIVSLIVKT
jgi:serine/threonine protein kinase